MEFLDIMKHFKAQMCAPPPLKRTTAPQRPASPR